jgi:hypothetical protein
VETGSLAEMIAELDRIAEELGLQIVIASARLEEVEAVLGQERLCIPGPGSTKLW